MKKQSCKKLQGFKVSSTSVDLKLLGSYKFHTFKRSLVQLLRNKYPLTPLASFILAACGSDTDEGDDGLGNSGLIVTSHSLLYLFLHF